MATEQEQAHEYHNIRERLTNGYGAHIQDQGISLRPKPVKPPSVAISVPIRTIDEDVQRQHLKLQRQIDGLVASMANMVDRIVEIGEKLGSFNLDTFKEEKVKETTVSEIFKMVAEGECVPMVVLKGKRRTRKISHTRAIISYLASQYTTKSLNVIGKVLGNKDHTSVLHGVNKIIAMRKDNPELDQRIAGYEGRIRVLLEGPK